MLSLNSLKARKIEKEMKHAILMKLGLLPASPLAVYSSKVILL